LPPREHSSRGKQRAGPEHFDQTGKPLERYVISPYGERIAQVDLKPPAIEQVRLQSGEIWIETSEEVLASELERGVAGDPLDFAGKPLTELFAVTFAAIPASEDAALMASRLPTVADRGKNDRTPGGPGPRPAGGCRRRAAACSNRPLVESGDGTWALRSGRGGAVARSRSADPLGLAAAQPPIRE